MGIDSIIMIINENSGLITSAATIATACATVVLAYITQGYLKETKKIREDSENSRIESKKPILSFQSDDIPSTEGKTLYLCNYGPIARNVSFTSTAVSVTGSPTILAKHFLYTLGQGERIAVCGEWTVIQKNKGKIWVEITFHDADMRRHSSSMVLDYFEIQDKGTIAIPVLHQI